MAGFAQDYIITWQNDTVYCRLPENPRKEGIRPAGKYHNGHIRFAAFFGEDSLRILEPKQVKGYFREKHGKKLLCDGHFDARKAIYPGRDTSWYYMSRTVQGEYASLYTAYFFAGSRPVRYFFIQKHHAGAVPYYAVYATTHKMIRELLADKDIETEMRSFLTGKRKRKLADAIKEYNRLKAAVKGK